MNALKTGFSKISLSLIVILVFAVSSYSAIDQTTIAGAWLFDEGSGTIAKDTSSNGKDGNIQGGVNGYRVNLAKQSNLMVQMPGWKFQV